MKYRSKAPPEGFPFRRKSDRYLRAKPPAAVGKDDALEWICTETWQRFEAASTNAHRLASSQDVWIERFGSDLLLSYQQEAARDLLLPELATHFDCYGFAPRRVLGKYLPIQAPERSAPALLWGDAEAPAETEVLEAGVRYGLDFAGGYSAGLFIDQRANRARLRGRQPKRVLNTFAYTCSFSVVAALAGAETVSVDLSRRSLARGQDNFRRNGLDLERGHHFIADDVLEVLPRLERRGEKFDSIILDPPTFSRNQDGKAFNVQRDFEQLVTLALDVAARDARILLSVNHSTMRVADLERAARNALKLAGRSGRFEHEPPLPDFPPGHGAKTVWLEVR